jgi:hypothetical protein
VWCRLLTTLVNFRYNFESSAEVREVDVGTTVPSVHSWSRRICNTAMSITTSPFGLSNVGDQFLCEWHLVQRACAGDRAMRGTYLNPADVRNSFKPCRTTSCSSLGFHDIAKIECAHHVVFKVTAPALRGHKDGLGRYGPPRVLRVRGGPPQSLAQREVIQLDADSL